MLASFQGSLPPKCKHLNFCVPEWESCGGELGNESKKYEDGGPVQIKRSSCHCTISPFCEYYSVAPLGKIAFKNMITGVMFCGSTALGWLASGIFISLANGRHVFANLKHISAQSLCRCVHRMAILKLGREIALNNTNPETRTNPSA